MTPHHALCTVYGFFFHRNNGKTSHKLLANDAGNAVNFMVIPYTPLKIRKNTGKSVHELQAG